MKTKVLAAVSAIGFAWIVVATANAQSWGLTADIPFSFIVGEKEMPSGKYTVRILGESALVIQSSETHKAAITLSNSMLTPSNLKNGRLVFNLYGNQHFLSSVSWPDGPSRILPPADVEHQAAKAASRQKLAVAAK